MLYYLRYPVFFAAAYATFMFMSPYFFSQKTREPLYSTSDFNQDMSKMYCDIGLSSQKRHDFKSAIKAYTMAIEKNPYYLECYDYLGTCFELCHQLDKALKTYLKAMSISPSFIETRTKTFKTLPPHDPFENSPLPAKQCWKGQPLDNKIIYVYAEAGIGDTIFFLRFLPQIIKPGTKILFKPQPELYTLLKETLGKDIELLNATQEPDPSTFDYYTQLHSIPSNIKASYTQIPSRNGYLNANAKKVGEFKKAFFDNPSFKIGIVWQGNPNHTNDKNRSIPLSYFSPLTTIPGVKVYSLQKGYGVEQLENNQPNTQITNLDPYLHDFADNAAAIENLDLLISVDTGMAHLGGALGKPTLILLPYVTDWRWFGYSEGDQSCWYSRVKKFRQKKAGNWQEVFERITKQITYLTTKKGF